MKRTLLLTILGVLLSHGTRAQLAQNPDKFLGNITTSYQIDYGTEKFYQLWNQITPENETKWDQIEGWSRGSFSWTNCDRIYNYAKTHKFPFKFHTLVWGSQYPKWMDNLSKEQQLKALTEWMDAVKKRYPDLKLINVELTQQFLTHMRVALWAGLLVVSPYILYHLFAFVAPGLYRTERRLAVRAVVAGYLLFLAGVALNYFVIFPFTVRFLGGYQVSADVENTITLGSYIAVLGVLSLVMGVVFELPVLCWLLAKMGVLKAGFMKRYRRHAIVVIVILAAVITPTGDPFTLSLVAVPIYLLWELSIMVVKHVER